MNKDKFYCLKVNIIFIFFLTRGIKMTCYRPKLIAGPISDNTRGKTLIFAIKFIQI